MANPTSVVIICGMVSGLLWAVMSYSFRAFDSFLSLWNVKTPEVESGHPHMKIWVARDSSGDEVWAFQSQPSLENGMWDVADLDSMELPKHLLPGLKPSQCVKLNCYQEQ